MPNTTLDKEIAAVPKFRDRISLFTKKLRLAQYADGSIYDYRLKIAQAVLFFRVLSQEQIARLIRNCSLYDKIPACHHLRLRPQGRRGMPPQMGRHLL